MKSRIIILLVLALLVLFTNAQRITKPPSKPRPQEPVQQQAPGSASKTVPIMSSGSNSGSGAIQTTPLPVENSVKSTPTGSSSGSSSGSEKKKEEPKDGRTPLVFNGKEKEKPVEKPTSLEPPKPIIPTALIPPATLPPQCVKQMCCRFNFTTYPIYKYVKTKIEVPKYIYYTSFGNGVETQMTAFQNYSSKIHTYRYLLDHVRLILKELVTSEKLKIDLFHKSDKVLQNKKLSFERRIQQKAVTQRYCDKEVTKLRNLLKKLEINLENPSSCVIIGGKRKCGLIERQNLLNGESKFYVKNRLFKTTFYARVPVKISRIQRNSGYVSFKKRSSHWEKRTSRAHLKVRRIVYKNARTAFIQSPLVKAEISARVKRQSRSKNPLTVNAITLELMTTKFKKEYFDLVRKELATKSIVEMRKQFKDIVLSTKPEQAIETEELVSLPKSIARLPNKKLKQILMYKISYD